jgi:Putative phage tail protein
MAQAIPFIVSLVVNLAVSYAIRAIMASHTNTNTLRRGNQLNQLDITSSAHGELIPVVKGSSRVSGNVIFANDIVRKTHTSTQSFTSGGGKGGGSSQTETITTETYTYHATFAVALCKGPIKGVTRIYAANNIIYNVGLDADTPTLTKSLAFKAATLTFYDGTETQTIDPIISAALGADATAFRGTAYIVFSDWDITSFGGIPPLSFEVVESGTTVGDQIQKDTFPIADFIQTLSTEAGVVADTTLVTGDARGLKLADTDNYREIIDALMDAFLLSSVESGGKIKFFDRNSNSILTIPATDMGASEGINENDVKITLVDEVALPREVEISFIDINQNYQSSAQLFKNEYGHSNKFSLPYPVVMTAGEARQKANILNDLLWTMRIQYEFKLPFKYIELEPGDVITIPVGNKNVIVYINQVVVGANGIIEITANHHDTDSFTSSTGGDESNVSSTTGNIGLAGDSVALFYNLPALSPASDAPGIYACVSGTNQNWFNAVIFRSIDGGVSFDPYVNITAPCPTGVVDTLIPAGRDKYLFDDITTIDITLDDNHELESFNDSAILKGKNLAIFGTELIQFGTVSKIGVNKYRLSHLLNGRGETWRYMADHAIGEKFAYIGAAQFIEQADSAINRKYLYKVVSNGQDVNTVGSFEFINTGETLKPYSPINIAGSRDGSSNLTITWLRRSRTFFAWTGGIPVPLGEASEQYEIDIMSGTTVKRTIAATSESAVYSAADQTTDFGSAQPSIEVNIYQISAKVGRGTGENAII